MSEQAKFQAWWDECGFNSAILRVAAWEAWMARAKADQPQPQPAEDPDEWVIQDRVPIRDEIDEGRYQMKGTQPGEGDRWFKLSRMNAHTRGLMHGSEHRFDLNCNLHVRCRRRDLPKVEQPEQWPKYYKSPNGIVERGTTETCVHTTSKGESGVCDWLKVYDQYVTDGDCKQITEAEAMAMLKPKQCCVGCHGPRCPNPALPNKDHCSECANDDGTDWSYHNQQKPQPKKTMLRLWIDSDCNIHAGLKGDRDLELLYDHETRQFYTEEPS